MCHLSLTDQPLQDIFVHILQLPTESRHSEMPWCPLTCGEKSSVDLVIGYYPWVSRTWVFDSLISFTFI